MFVCVTGSAVGAFLMPFCVVLCCVLCFFVFVWSLDCCSGVIWFSLLGFVVVALTVLGAAFSLWMTMVLVSCI